MRIARPREPEANFRRKRAPPPQATKLLRASLAAALIFVALLAVVFVPRFLEYSNPCQSTILTLSRAGSRIALTDATAVLEVNAFFSSLTRDNLVVGTLGPGLSNGNLTLDFVDWDNDTRLGPGDYFSWQGATGGEYRFEVFLVCDGRRVGLLTWTVVPE